MTAELAAGSASVAGAPVGSAEKPAVLCVFCGASGGKSPAHTDAATALAHVMHRRGMRLVYGGGTTGIMGQVARTLVKLSGPDAVHGIIPVALVEYEQSAAFTAATAEAEGELRLQQGDDADSPGSEHFNYTAQYGRLTKVPDMHSRKRMMAEEVMAGGPGSGFVALSGGYGTFEELMEITTWNQIGIHSRGVAVYNVDGYWDGLRIWIEGAVKAGFVSEGCRNIIVFGHDAEEVVDLLAKYENASGRLQLDWESEGGAK